MKGSVQFILSPSDLLIFPILYLCEIIRCVALFKEMSFTNTDSSRSMKISISQKSNLSLRLCERFVYLYIMLNTLVLNAVDIHYVLINTVYVITHKNHL